MSRNAGSDENGNSGEISSVNLTIFLQITSTEMGLTCWRIWRFWLFLCKLQRVGEFCDFGNFYANYITRDALTCWRIWRFGPFLLHRVEAEQKDIYFLHYITRVELTCWRLWRFGWFLLHHEWRPSRKIYTFSSFIKRVAQAKYFLYDACRPRGEWKAILIYISLALYFLRSVSVLPNRIPRYKACYPCVTESQINLPTSKACFSSGTESNVSFWSFWNRSTRAQWKTMYISFVL